MSISRLVCFARSPAFAHLRGVDLKRMQLKPVVDGAGLRRIYRWSDLPDDPIAELEALKGEVTQATSSV